MRTIGGPVACGFVGTLCVGLILLAATSLAGAHTMKQVRAELDLKDGEWSGAVFLEAWSLYPEDGPEVPPGVPGDDDFADADWLRLLDPVDHARMRWVADGFVKRSFQLTVDGKELQFTTEFPDFQKTPLEFGMTQGGNAVIRVDLIGTEVLPAEGNLQLVWNDEQDQPLALQVRHLDTDGGQKLAVLRLNPRKAPLTLLRLEQGKVEEGSEPSSLWTWIVAGYQHILPKGLDHILFILGLFLLVQKWKPLLWQVSAFTVAHSITLALVVLGLVEVPSTVVEPMIALSISYVGIENLWTKKLHSWRVALVFGLGLLHGMGFANVMQQLDIPQDSVIKPLVGFNLGVELGQITVLACAFLLTSRILRKKSFKTVRMGASGLIGVVGLYWTFQRIFM